MKMFLVADTDGAAKLFKDEKEAVNDFNESVIEYCQIDDLDTYAVGDGEYDEASTVIATDVEVSQVTPLTQMLMDTLDELLEHSEVVEMCASMILSGVASNDELVELFGQKIVDEANNFLEKVNKD